MVIFFFFFFLNRSRRAFAYGAFAGGISLFAYSAVALVLWYGGTLVLSQKGEMDAGTLITFLLYTIYVAGALGGLSSLFGNLMNAGKKILSLLWTILFLLLIDL